MGGPSDRNAGEELTVPLAGHVIGRVSDDARRLEGALRGHERRQHPRFAVGLTAYLQIDGVAGQSSAGVGDISLGGLLLRVDGEPVAVGTRVRLVMELPFFTGHRMCTLSGRVVRLAREGGPGGRVVGAGVEFDADSARQDRLLLQDFLTLWGSRRTEPLPGGGSAGEGSRP